MSTTLLPRARLGAKKTTISTSWLRELKPPKPIEIGKVSKKDSFAQKFGVILDFLKKEYKRDKKSWFIERKERQEEGRKKREEKLEKKKKKVKLGKGISAPLPLKNIFDSISNFLLFLAGGVLFNKLFDLESGLNIIQKSFGAIGTGVQIFANLVGGFTNFIDSAVKGYDDFLQKIEDVTGFDKGKIEKFMEDFKFVINGAVIAAILTIRALPVFIRRWMRNRNTRLPGNMGNTRFNMINNRRTISGGRPLKPGPLSGIREWIRNKRFRGAPTITGDASLSQSISRSKLIEGKPGWRKNLTGMVNRFNPLKNNQVFKNIKIPKIPKLPWLTGALAILDFANRRQSGENNLQAGVGVGGGLLGMIAGTALTALVIPEPTSSVAGAVVLGIMSALGYNWGSQGADATLDLIQDNLNQDLQSKTDGNTTVSGLFSLSGSGSSEELRISRSIPSDAVAGIDRYADYTQHTQWINNIIQPIEV